MLPSPSEVREQLLPVPEDEEKEELSPATTLHVDCIDKRGHRYLGAFHYRVPTLGDLVEIGKMKTFYLPQGAAADDTARLLIEEICYLEVTLQKPRPSWWEPFKMFDPLPVHRLYAEAMSYERRFLGRAQVDGSGAGAGSESAEDAGAVPVEAHDGAGASARAVAKRRTIASTDDS